MQTLNSYARLIWVRHLHGISDNCQSPKIGAQMRLCGHFRYAKIFNTRVHVWPFIESIVRKVALIRGSFRLRGYAGGDLEENLSTLGRMPSVRSAHTVSGLPGQPGPMLMSGFLLSREMWMAPVDVTPQMPPWMQHHGCPLGMRHCGCSRRSCRRLRSFDLVFYKQNQKIAAFGSSYGGLRFRSGFIGFRPGFMGFSPGFIVFRPGL